MDKAQIKAQIKERRQQAGDGVAINITDLIGQMIQPPPGFSMKFVSPQEASVALRSAQINILDDYCGKMNVTPAQIVKLREWLTNQDRLMDGCITFEFTPCSMGTVVKATNSLTQQTVNLTEY
jgi:hypothetical protein